MTTSPSLKKKHPRFFSERIHAPADSFISENEGMNEEVAKKLELKLNTLQKAIRAGRIRMPAKKKSPLDRL
jgi:hypothetical protein